MGLPSDTVGLFFPFVHSHTLTLTLTHSHSHTQRPIENKTAMQQLVCMRPTATSSSLRRASSPRESVGIKWQVSIVKPFDLYIKHSLWPRVSNDCPPKKEKRKKKYLWVSSSVSHESSRWLWWEGVTLYSTHTYLHTYTWALLWAGTVIQ